jgi:hypothetical protein
MFKRLTTITLLFMIFVLPLPMVWAESLTMAYKVSVTLPPSVSITATELKLQETPGALKDLVQMVQTQRMMRDGQSVLIRTIVVL